MNSAFLSEVRAHGTAAIDLLNELTLEDTRHTDKDLAEIVAAIVRLRDTLIDARRSGTDCRAWLARSNGILSAIIGTEFPIGGLQWKRISETRDALKAFLDAVPKSGD